MTRREPKRCGRCNHFWSSHKRGACSVHQLVEDEQGQPCFGAVCGCPGFVLTTEGAL